MNSVDMLAHNNRSERGQCLRMKRLNGPSMNDQNKPEMIPNKRYFTGIESIAEV